LVETGKLMPLVAAHKVNRLVAGDRVKPRAKSLSLFELLDSQMHAQKSSLEHILRVLGISQKTAEKGVQFPFVAPDQFLEIGRVPLCLVACNQFLVRDVGLGIGGLASGGGKQRWLWELHNDEMAKGNVAKMKA
jgi:hypothetical protein